MKFVYCLLAFLLLVTVFSGCARFSTLQTDTSITEKDGKTTRTVTTEARAVTLFEASSALANFKATQTDKTQSASVGALNQESGGTNTMNDAAIFLGTLIKSAK